MKTFALAASLAITALVGTSFAEDLPSAANLVKKHLEASGGKAAMMKVKTRIDKGKLTLTEMGMEATYVSYNQAPNSLNISDFAGMGIVKNGTTDGVAWAINPFQGNTKTANARPDEIFPFVNLDLVAGSAKTLGEEDLEGKIAYEVEFQVPVIGALVVFFDKESGLVAASESKNDDGTVTRSSFSDYKKVGDIQIPHTIKQTGGPLALVITSESIELDAEIPAGTFDLPEEIKALP